MFNQKDPITSASGLSSKVCLSPDGVAAVGRLEISLQVRERAQRRRGGSPYPRRRTLARNGGTTALEGNRAPHSATLDSLPTRDLTCPGES
jgi:hypothetical protein